MIFNVDKLGDKIVEIGTISSWEYTKYESGKIELRRVITWSPSTFTSWGQIFYINAQITVPEGLCTELKYFDAIPTSNQVWMSFNGFNGNTIANVRFFSATTASKAYGCHAFIEGRWK